MPGQDLLQRRLLGVASLLCVGTAVRKPAAGLRIHGARELPLEQHALFLMVDVCDGDRGEQALRVGMELMLEELVRAAFLRRRLCHRQPSNIFGKCLTSHKNFIKKKI